MSELVSREKCATQVQSWPLARASLGQITVAYLNLKCMCQN